MLKRSRKKFDPRARVNVSRALCDV